MLRFMDLLKRDGASEMGRRLGYSAQYMSQVRHGRRAVSLEMLRRAQEAYPGELDFSASALDALKATKWADVSSEVA